MELILNELSLDGQFESIEEDFVEYFKECLRPIWDVMCEKEVLLLKKSDFYDRKITKTETVLSLLKQVNNPIATVLKEYIVKMAIGEPYWDMTSQTCNDTEYTYPSDSDIPNCFTEAIERKVSLFSFTNSEFEERMYACTKDKEIVEVENILEYKEFLLLFLRMYTSEIRYVLEKNRYLDNYKIECAVVNQKCYAEQALLENDLNFEDFRNIIENIPALMNSLLHGEKTKLWDGFGKGLFEYRLNVSAGRIFRLFFIQREKKIIFLNGFIKKSQETPKHELDKAKWIKGQLKQIG